MSIDHAFHFGLTSHDRSHFTNQYSTPKESSNFQQKTRSFASTRGLEIETVATERIAYPQPIESEDLEYISNELNNISNFLRPRLVSIRVEDGKTLSHTAVLPFYLETQVNYHAVIENLAKRLDRIHGLSLFEVFEKITEPSTDDEEQEIRNTQIKYYIDSLLIISRITRDGIGEDLGMFGKLLPDIQIRDPNSKNNAEVTQLDGIFIPKGITYPNNTSVLDREMFVRSYAKKDPNFAESVPPILRFPILEIKTNFRPRWTFASLSRQIPPYVMREVTTRVGRSTVYAELALAPTAIIVARLRSLGPNYIYHFYPDKDFYGKWQRDVWEKLENLWSANMKSLEAENLELAKTFSDEADDLIKLFPFLGWEAARLEQKDAEEQTSKVRIQIPDKVRQPKIRGLKIGQPINLADSKPESKYSQARAKKKIVKIIPDRLF